MNSYSIKDYVITPSEVIKLRKFILNLKSKMRGTTSIKDKLGKNELNDLIDEGMNELKVDENTTLSTGETQFDLTAITRRTTRLFLITYILTNVYENLLIGLLRRKSPSKFLKDSLSISALRLAAFISSYSTLYRFLYRQLQLNLPSRDSTATATKSTSSVESRLYRRINLIASSSKLVPFLAGSLASITMLLESPNERRVTFAIYALTRSIQSGFAATCTSSKGKRYLPQSLRDGSWFFGGHILFAISNAILLHAFVFDPETFPSSYSNFILKYSGAYLPTLPSNYSPSTPFPTSRQIVDAIASSASLNYPSFISPLLHPNSAKNFKPNETLSKILPILSNTHPGHTNLTCAFLHPSDTSCWNVFQGFVKHEFKGATKFFGALALLSALVRYKKSLKEPEKTITKSVLSTLTSSLFLSLSIGTAWGTICLGQHYLPSSFLPKERFYLQGFLAGLWVSLVSIGTGSGTTDLGWYSVRLALPTAWKVSLKKNWFRKRFSFKNGEVVYFALSMGVLMGIYDCNPKSISSGFVKKVLKVIGGESKVEKAVKDIKEVEK